MLKRARNPEGRMPLRAHLVELRNRVLVAGLAVLVGAVVGWFVYDPVFEAIIAPLRQVADDSEGDVSVNFGNVATSFDLKVQISIWLGVIVSSPVWIFQLWAFITPGLTRRERWYATGFMLAAVPLFLGGVALAFGIAFLIPVVMVAMNFTGLVSARALAKGWRVAIVAIFVFAAIASPTPDVTTMFALAGPMVVLFFAAVGIAWANDWRRARRDGTAGLADDEASAIDDAPSSIAEV